MRNKLSCKTYLFDFKGYSNDVIMDVFYGVTKKDAIDAEGNEIVYCNLENGVHDDWEHDSDVVDITEDTMEDVAMKQKRLNSEIKAMLKGKILPIDRDIKDGDCLYDGTTLYKVHNYDNHLYAEYMMVAKKKLGYDNFSFKSLSNSVIEDCMFVPNEVYDAIESKLVDMLRSTIKMLDEKYPREMQGWYLERSIMLD